MILLLFLPMPSLFPLAASHAVAAAAAAAGMAFLDRRTWFPAGVHGV
jgi:hypothetical protein